MTGDSFPSEPVPPQSVSETGRWKHPAVRLEGTQLPAECCHVVLAVPVDAVWALRDWSAGNQYWYPCGAHKVLQCRASWMGVTIETGILVYLRRGQLCVVKDDLSDAAKSNTGMPTRPTRPVVLAKASRLLSIEF